MIENLIAEYCLDQSFTPILHDWLMERSSEPWVKGYLARQKLSPMDCLNLLCHFGRKETREKCQKHKRKMTPSIIRRYFHEGYAYLHLFLTVHIIK